MKNNGHVVAKVNRIALEISGLTDEQTQQIEEQIIQQMTEYFKNNPTRLDDSDDVNNEEEELKEKDTEEDTEEDTEDYVFADENNEYNENNQVEMEDALHSFVYAANNTGKGIKDKDLMSDTGGSYKQDNSLAKDKPPREDSKTYFKPRKLKDKEKSDFSDVQNDKDLKIK